VSVNVWQRDFDIAIQCLMNNIYILSKLGKGMSKLRVWHPPLFLVHLDIGATGIMYKYVSFDSSNHQNCSASL
jgi:hypothetical protein